MKFAFVDAERAQWPVAALCEMLEVSRSGYYAWTTRGETPRVQLGSGAQCEAEETASGDAGRPQGW